MATHPGNWPNPEVGANADDLINWIWKLTVYRWIDVGYHLLSCILVFCPILIPVFLWVLFFLTEIEEMCLSGRMTDCCVVLCFDRRRLHGGSLQQEDYSSCLWCLSFVVHWMTLVQKQSPSPLTQLYGALCIFVNLESPAVKWVKFTVVNILLSQIQWLNTAFVAAVKQSALFAHFHTQSPNCTGNRSILLIKSQCNIRVSLKLIFQFTYILW